MLPKAINLVIHNSLRNESDLLPVHWTTNTWQTEVYACGADVF